MSIQSEINRIKQNISNAYVAIASLGATMPSVYNSSSLASTINTIISSLGKTATSNDILLNKTAVVENQLVVRTIQSKGTETYNVSTNNQTINSGQYLSGNQVFRGVTTLNLEPQYIMDGVTISVGDSENSGRISSITGTLDGIQHVSSTPTTKISNIIYNTTTGRYYVWRS